MDTLAGVGVDTPAGVGVDTLAGVGMDTLAGVGERTVSSFSTWWKCPEMVSGSVQVVRVRVPKCFFCSPFYGRACRWAMLGAITT